MKTESDFIVIGAGIIGLSVARELIDRYPNSKIIILEKESGVAFHSSGRNSGVLHAGFYYTADSLKAKFTRDGNRALREFCYSNNLNINESKKVVVARNESELPALFELEKRGITNGVDVKLIDEKELFSIDSNVKTFKNALYSPSTATVDPVELTQAVEKEIIRKGVSIHFNEAYGKRIDGNTIKTRQQNIYSAGTIINTAGLYADKIAKDFGFSQSYTIIPFKGIYLKYKGDNPPVRVNVYPVPNLKNPFLGVHFTVTVDGTVKIGPTSTPAFWRENYQGFSNFNMSELTRILLWEARLFSSNAFGFRSLAIEEIKKYNKKYFTGLAGELVKQMDVQGFKEWGSPGIRAQLLDIKTKELVMDFVVEGDTESVHVLNAVSPAFTCSFSFSKWVVDNYIKR